MKSPEELLLQYTHSPEEFPVLSRQTHKVMKNGKIENELININENIIHYLRDTVALISMIDGSAEATGRKTYPYDHVVYLDKSARPVSWLVNMFWDDFAAVDKQGRKAERPPHSYINIDRAPWFRNVGIEVTDDGRQKENGELATYSDFERHIGNLNPKHLAEIRALYIRGGISREDIPWVMEQPSMLDGKRVLIIDEVSRTGSTLRIAERLFRLAFPDAAEITGSYFWHPSEQPITLGQESVLTSLPVWYDPGTLTGRGIGGLDPAYHRKRYEYYADLSGENPDIDVKKLRTYAFSGDVYSAPLLKDDGSILDLAEEKITRMLCRDLKKLYHEYHRGMLFFMPPMEWEQERFENAVRKQGIRLLSDAGSRQEAEKLRRDPLFYLNFISRLMTM